MRKIPATMATQHPDNAAAPYWDLAGGPFINTQKELDDCLSSFQDLNMPEYMWDWEGKYADAAVVDKLFSTRHEYFEKHPLGRDKFLTFRLPNIWQEKGYSLMQAMSVILSSEDFGRDLGFADRPLFEVILPMTEKADQIMHMHHLFEKTAQFKSKVFNHAQRNTDYLELIPLVESVEGQLNILNLLEEYQRLHQAKYKRKLHYLRPFLARSDPALVSGLLATALANKLGLSQIYEFSANYKVPVHPIAGVGSLPFRGGLMPESISTYISENPGIRTVTVQSSFRFDHPLGRVKSAINELNRSLPRTPPKIFNPNRQKDLKKIILDSQAAYQSSLSGLVKDMQSIFDAVPRRRERRQHIGLIAYKRSMGKHQLPRAIVFTGGFYSIGVPPEFIGIGNALREMTEKQRQITLATYPSLPNDLIRAGKYLNRKNLQILAKRNRAWAAVEKSVHAVEGILGLHFEPQSFAEKSHINLSANVLLAKNNRQALPALIAETALLRRSLG